MVPTTSKRGTVKTLLAKAGLVVAVLGYFAYVLRRDWDQQLFSVKELSFPFLLAAVVILILHILIMAWNWKDILAGLGFRIRFREAGRIWFLSQVGKYFPGRIWVIASRIYLGRKNGLPAQQVMASLYMEFLLAPLGSILVASTALLLSREAVDPWLVWSSSLFFLCGFILIHPRIVRLFDDTWARLRKAEQHLKPLPYSQSVVLLMRYSLSWVLYGVSGYFLIQGLLPSSPPGLCAVIGHFSLAWFIGFASFFAPAGIGPRDGALAFFLSSYMPPAQGIVVALAARLVSTGVELSTFLFAKLTER